MRPSATGPFALVALIVAIIAAFVAGMFMSLFGPTPAGRAGFSRHVLGGGAIPQAIQRSQLQGLSVAYPGVARYRFLVRAAIAVCVVVYAIAFIARFFVSGAPAGVADGTIPVFEQQPPYRLNNHGEHTVVSRSTYLVIGSSDVIAWHIFGVLFTLMQLHLALFGNHRPPEPKLRKLPANRRAG